MSAPGGRALLKLLQLVDLGAASQEPGGMCVVWTCACVRVSPCMCVYTASVRSCARVCRCLHPRVCAHMRMEDTHSAHQPPAALTYNYTNHSLPAGSFVWRPAQRLKSSPHAPTLQEKVSAPRRWKFSFFSLFVQRHPLHNILLLRNLTVASTANSREQGVGMGQQLLIQVLGRLLSTTEIFWSRTWAVPCVGLRGSPEQVHPRPPKPLGPPEGHGCRVPAFAPSWTQSGLLPSLSSPAADPHPPPPGLLVWAERVCPEGHLGMWTPDGIAS